VKLNDWFTRNKIILIIVLFIGGVANSQTKKTAISGVVMDEYGYGIPYAAISIAKSNVGTSTIEDGSFNLMVSEKNYGDTLSISSIGFKTKKIRIGDYVSKKNKTIILDEITTKLTDIKLLSNVEYVKRALKHLKYNTISKPHELNILYRRASVEDNKSRFFVEHYMKLLDEGPSGILRKIEVVEGRKSSDYRMVKRTQFSHSVNYMITHNPLRQGINIKTYKWSKIGDSNYDGEDIVIIEGRKSKNNFIRLYIGMDIYKIYKIETSKGNATFLYKKNEEGELYLSYHNRESKSNIEPNEELKRSFRIANREIPKKIKIAYRHEVFVLGLETDKNKINVNNFGGYGIDIGDVEVPYNEQFWKSFAMPPDTEFFKRIKTELESHFGVALETQYKLSN